MFGCPEPDPNIDQCDIVAGSAGETRTLEIGASVYIDPTGPAVFVPFEEGSEVAKTFGFQGADMIVSRYRFPALPEDGLEERCMIVDYQRGGLGDASFQVRLRFEREGDHWLSAELFDPLDGTGELTLEATVEDNIVTGSSSVTVFLVDY